jgi:cell fate (sporulation/competence/biofilm development) regulator YmcA (YheA/YmcA/DUF963 family)
VVLTMNVHEQNVNFLKALQTYYPSEIVEFDEFRDIELQIMRIRGKVIRKMNPQKSFQKLKSTYNDFDKFKECFREISVSYDRDEDIKMLYDLLNSQENMNVFEKEYITAPSRVWGSLYRRVQTKK